MTTDADEPLAARVARHYDVLDPYYRRLWGEHLHHGLWLRGDESVEQATLALVRRVAERAGIGPGATVVDVGSGYGATARLLATEWKARVTAVTLSSVQHARATRAPPVDPPPDYRLADFASSGLPSAAFDAAVAIESLSHVEDLDAALAEVRRVLRPGGRFVACLWLAGRTAGPLRRRFLVEPIVREGRLARLATEDTYRRAFDRAGLTVERVEDLTRQVRRTWWICTRRVAGRLARDREVRRLVAGGGEWSFARAVPRLLIAYRVGALRYGMLTATRPGHTARNG